MNWAKREAGLNPWESTLSQTAVNDTSCTESPTCQVVIIRWRSSSLYNYQDLDLSQQIYWWVLAFQAPSRWFAKLNLCMELKKTKEMTQISVLKVQKVIMCLLLQTQMQRPLLWHVIISVYYGRMIALRVSWGHATECLLVNKQPAATDASTHH